MKNFQIFFIFSYINIRRPVQGNEIEKTNRNYEGRECMRIEG